MIDILWKLTPRHSHLDLDALAPLCVDASGVVGRHVLLHGSARTRPVTEPAECGRRVGSKHAR